MNLGPGQSLRVGRNIQPLYSAHGSAEVRMMDTTVIPPSLPPTTEKLLVERTSADISGPVRHEQDQEKLKMAGSSYSRCAASEWHSPVVSHEYDG